MFVSNFLLKSESSVLKSNSSPGVLKMSTTTLLQTITQINHWLPPAPVSQHQSPEVLHHSSSLLFTLPGLSMPKKDDGRPWTSRSLFTKAEKEETQLPTKWSAWPRMYRSIWAESGWRLTTCTCRRQRENIYS